MLERSDSETHGEATRRLVIIAGQEGVGKSTVVRALLPRTAHGAQIDAEDVGQVNPWHWDDAFKCLLWNNVAALARNFWDAGYTTVIAGSFINDYPDYAQFRTRVAPDVMIDLVHLCASKATRDRRRIERPKPSSKEWRDELDRHVPEDVTLGDTNSDYRYCRIDTSGLTLADTLERIQRALPDVFERMARRP
jgi:hypothetical protein